MQLPRGGQILAPGQARDEGQQKGWRDDQMNTHVDKASIGYGREDMLLMSICVQETRLVVLTTSVHHSVYT